MDVPLSLIIPAPLLLFVRRTRFKQQKAYVALYLVLLSVALVPARILQQDISKIYEPEKPERGPLRDPPTSPWGAAKDICPPNGGGPYSVKNYPGEDLMVCVPYTQPASCKQMHTSSG
jgi:hypothetical protein